MKEPQGHNETEYGLVHVNVPSGRIQAVAVQSGNQTAHFLRPNMVFEETASSAV